MSRNSPTCKSGKTGRPLTEYDTKAEAKAAAGYANKTYRNNNLVPYKCKQCGFWHLSPADRQTPSETCPVCRGADGKPKESYSSQENAQRRADIILKEQSVILKVYECEHGNGWHLTKQNIN